MHWPVLSGEKNGGAGALTAAQLHKTAFTHCRCRPPPPPTPLSGEGSFGILAYGSCGYTNSDESLPFPRAAYAAAADGNQDYPGGRMRSAAPERAQPRMPIGHPLHRTQLAVRRAEGPRAFRNCRWTRC